MKSTSLLSTRCLITSASLQPRRRLLVQAQSSGTSPVIAKTGLVLRRGEEGSWDSGLVGNPVVCCFVGDNEQRWSMYYTGLENQESNDITQPLSGTTGVVTSSDGFYWKKPQIERVEDDGLNIVLKANKEDWWAFDTSSVSVSDVQIMFSPQVNSGEEGVYWMYYSGSSNEPISMAEDSRQMVMRSGLAMSQDGYHWARIEGSDPSGAILDTGEEEDWDHTFIGRSQVLNCGNKDLRIIGLATSINGLQWKKNGILFSGSEKYKFDCKGAASQSVVYDQDNKQFLMFYEAVDEFNGRSVGVAVSKDGLKDWVVYEKPVLQVAELGSWDSGAVGTPWAVSMEEGKWRIYYSGTTKSAPNWEGIGVCVSDQTAPRFYGVPTSFKRKQLRL